MIKTFNDNEGPQWKHSLFGNPNDPETFRLVIFICLNVAIFENLNDSGKCHINFFIVAVIITCNYCLDIIEIQNTKTFHMVIIVAVIITCIFYIFLLRVNFHLNVKIKDMYELIYPSMRNKR